MKPPALALVRLTVIMLALGWLLPAPVWVGLPLAILAALWWKKRYYGNN